ncbi:MAG: HAMP domain-containing histidine kinase, partial [Arcobacteraceae bacterium]|nr:HAMP domain-containing histidine kinase [Arcobacteraceae bacterium]
WRQPLSVISTVASGMQVEKSYGLLSDERFENSCEAIIRNTDYLSKTIDTFRNFIKEEKELKEVVIQDRINIALDITQPTLKGAQINLVNNIDYNNKISIFITVGELSQVIINIINNAKDILLEKNIEEPTITIDLKRINDTAIISIEDNGGGIEDDIITKIFDPYFTTKHQSQGTGLGLHMSYKIVTESLQGKLYTKNTNTGAKFFIEIPVVKENK